MQQEITIRLQLIPRTKVFKTCHTIKTPNMTDVNIRFSLIPTILVISYKLKGLIEIKIVK